MINNNDHVRDLEEYCSDTNSVLSLDILRKKLSNISPPSLACSHFLHELLNRSKNDVTLEMVQLVLHCNPYAAYICSNRYHGIVYTKEDVERHEIETGGSHGSSSPLSNICSDRAYPVHIASSNENCPCSIVVLLSRENPSALRHLCILKGFYTSSSGQQFEGLPLHYYLSRKSNMDLATVKELIAQSPDSLAASGGEMPYFPIHAIIENPEVGAFSDVLHYLIELDPTSLQCTDTYGLVPLHNALCNNNITMKIILLLLEGWQESIHQRDCNRSLPIHLLCKNGELNTNTKLNVLRTIIDAYPESLLDRNGNNDLPIHIASRFQDRAFCKVLIGACPECLSMVDACGFLPFHLACESGPLDTAKYIFEERPESLHAATEEFELYPLHSVVLTRGRGQFNVAQYLLRNDHDCVSKPVTMTGSIYQGYFPLHLACENHRTELRTMESLFDAYPGAVWETTPSGWTPLDIARDETLCFLKQQLRDFSSFSESSFPVHHALSNDGTIGVIKLLMDRFPNQLQVVDHERNLPLHLACVVGNLPSVQYLVKVRNESISVCDANRNYPLHLACMAGKCDVINYLLEMKTSHVSERNSSEKLPIQLLLEAGCENDNIESTEAIWRLLVAFPEIVPAG
mmetsp:Transcript_4753/g.10492  ORF Transcript_4753/g.10492 Transcript_4753/m.10492 type:complete len:630 (-) Transcript_4753:29-1918(-)